MKKNYNIPATEIVAIIGGKMMQFESTSIIDPNGADKQLIEG